MTVILTILKTIGIILLALLALIISLLLLALFFPVGYSVSGVSEEDVSVKGKVYWLFSALSFRFAYEKSELSTEIRIFGFRLKKREKDSSAEEDFSEDDSFSERESLEKTFSERESLEKEEEVRADEPENPSKAASETLVEEQVQEKETLQKEKASADTSGQKSARKKPGAFLKKGKELWHTITREENKATAKSALGELIYLLKHFSVRKIQAELTFSAGDPALTGQVLGVLCLLPFLYQKGVHITPDFDAEKWYVKGRINGTGHMRLVHVLCSLIRLWKDENIRKLIKNR